MKNFIFACSLTQMAAQLISCPTPCIALPRNIINESFDSVETSSAFTPPSQEELMSAVYEDNRSGTWNLASKNLVSGDVSFENFDIMEYEKRDNASVNPSGVSIPSLLQIGKCEQIRDVGQISRAPGYTPSGYVESDPISEPETRGVIGEDDRTEVTNTTDWPFRAVGYLYTVRVTHNYVTGLEDPHSSRGTAFLIGPNTIATAAHCVYGDSTKSYKDSNGVVHTEYEDNLFNPTFVNEITFYPGKSGSQNPLGSYAVTKVTIQREYYESLSIDWAVCELDTNIGFLTGWYGRISNYYIQGADFVSYGYPADLGRKMYRSAGQFTYFEDDAGCYRTNMDSAGGQSGSPYRIEYSDGVHYFCGIHTYSAYSGNVTVYTGGRRVDDLMFHFMNSFIISRPSLPGC